MSRRIICKVLGMVLLIEAALMLPSLIVSFIYGGKDAHAFIYSIIIVAAAGGSLALIKAQKNGRLYVKDGFAIVAFSWILMSLFGALPYMFSGTLPGLFDAVFESVSGFTTTGATTLTDIEGVSKGILFWRSFTNWIGGMGVLMFTLAIIPAIAGNMSIMKAEAPGYAPDKIVPKMGSTAKIFYYIYAGMTLAQVLALKLAGLPLYDALLASFSTAGTGGFSHLNLSVGGFHNPAAEWIIGVFMLLFGVNFMLYFNIIMRNFRSLLKSSEFKTYVAIVAVAICVICADVWRTYHGSAAIRHAFFQVGSIITSTGFATVNYDLWPNLSKSILLVLMLIGAMTGSTAGGIKVGRVIILVSSLRQKMRKLLHPNAVQPVRIDGKVISDDIVSSVLTFFFIYMLILFASFILVSFNEFSVISNLTAVIACLGNIGPGLDMIGPAGNFALYDAFSKMVLSFCMLAGRLEILPLALIIMPSFWLKKI